MRYGDYLSYKQVDENDDSIYDYVEITACDKSAEEVTVPDKIDGLPVRSIKSAAFFDCYFLTKLDLPESLVTIETNAFNNCRYLSSIEIPDSVTSMGQFVFQKYTHLTKVKLSENLTKIEDETFVNCRSLSSVSIPKNVTYLGKGAFLGCSELRSIVVPSSVKSIDMNAFKDCDNLTSIKIECSKCDIYDDENVFPKNAVIYGYKDSTAYTYSLKYGRNFVSLNGDTTITTPAVTTSPIVTTTTVSSSDYEATETSGNYTVPAITSSPNTTAENVATEVSTWATTQKPIAGYRITEVSCEASAGNIVMDSPDTPATILLELLSDNGVEAVVYPKLPDGFFIMRVFGENGSNLVYNAMQNSFVMTGNCAYIDICADKPVNPGKYKIEFDIKQSKSVENSSHDGDICYVYKYNVTGGEFVVPSENAVPGDLNGDEKISIADIVEMHKYLSNIKTVLQENFKQLDLNNDGKFNIFDSIVLKRQIIND